MSVSNLLNPETKKQEWSVVYCNELNCDELIADRGAGLPIVDVDVLDASNTQLTQGTGNIGNLTSIKTTLGINEELTVSFDITNFVGVVGANSSNGEVIITLGNDIAYPDTLNGVIGGSGSILARKNGTTEYGATTIGFFVGPNQDQISIPFAVFNATSDVLSFQFTLVYQIDV
jgi:hypothetical protein